MVAEEEEEIWEVGVLVLKRLMPGLPADAL